MSKRLTKALLRLCELEKKALETDVDFWKQEVKLNTQAFKEIVETNHGLHRELESLRSQNTALPDQVEKARFERDQARVELKALAEENERLRKTDGWVHIRDWFWAGRGRTVGQFLGGSLSLVELRGSQWYVRTDSSLESCGPPVYLYELPEPPIQDQAEETAVGDV